MNCFSVQCTSDSGPLFKCHSFDWCSNQTTWGNKALKILPLSWSHTELFRKWTHLSIRPRCPPGGFSHQWLAQSEAAALWKWWSFITCDVVTRCNQLMYPTKSDKSPFASWLSRFCGWQQLLWGHNAAAPFWTGQSQCIVGSSSCSLTLSLNEKNVNLPSPSFFLFAIPQKKKKKREEELMTFIAPVCRQHSEISSVYSEQLVPMWASDECAGTFWWRWFVSSEAAERMWKSLHPLSSCRECCNAGV